MAGNCYTSAGEAFMDHCLGFAPLTPSGVDLGAVVLVHGRPTLTVPPFTKFGHAWIEIGHSIVYDTEKGVAVPKVLYYQAGQIDAVECFRYDFTTMRRWINRTHHWGPWEGPEACGPINEREED